MSEPRQTAPRDRDSILSQQPETALGYLEQAKGFPELSLSLDTDGRRGYKADTNIEPYSFLKPEPTIHAEEFSEFISGFGSIGEIYSSIRTIKTSATKSPLDRFGELRGDTKRLFWDIKRISDYVAESSPDKPLVEIELPSPGTDRDENVITIDSSNGGEVYYGRAANDDVEHIADKETLAIAMLVAKLERLNSQLDELSKSVRDDNVSTYTTSHRSIITHQRDQLRSFINSYLDRTSESQGSQAAV
jgi:hypothetical protein